MTRTNTDRIDQLAKDTVETGSRVENLEQRVQRDLEELRETLAEQKASSEERLHDLELKLAVADEREAARTRDLNQLRDDFSKERDARVALQLENTVLKQQVQELTKRADLWDGRRWTVVLALFGAALSLAAGLIVTLVKK